MSKLSFNIKNIQNPLLRHYCRGQTVFSFEQDLIEDTDETKQEVRVNHQNNCKRRYGSNCIVLWSKFIGSIEKCNADRKTTIILRTIWAKFCYLTFIFLNAFEIENSMSLWLNIIKTLCGQYESNHIVCIVSCLYCFMCLMKIDQCFLNGRYRSNNIVRDSNFSKTFEIEKKAWTFNENLIGSLNFWTQKKTWIFGGDFYKILRMTIWVKP